MLLPRRHWFVCVCVCCVLTSLPPASPSFFLCCGPCLVSPPSSLDLPCLSLHPFCVRQWRYPPTQCVSARSCVGLRVHLQRLLSLLPSCTHTHIQTKTHIRAKRFRSFVFFPLLFPLDYLLRFVFLAAPPRLHDEAPLSLPPLTPLLPSPLTYPSPLPLAPFGLTKKKRKKRREGQPCVRAASSPRSRRPPLAISAFFFFRFIFSFLFFFCG